MTVSIADPKSPEAHNFRGSLLQRGGNLAEAVQEFREAVKLRPDFSLAHLNAGLTLAAMGNRPAAEIHLRQAAAGPDPNIQRQATAALRQLSGQ